MANRIPLESGKYYHIYNRGINGTRLFYEERNYYFFLEKYAYYTTPVMDTLAYCLMGNHFHVLVKIKSEAERTQVRKKSSPKSKYITLDPSRQLGHVFNSYAQAINKKYGRTGGLFEAAFRRKEVTSEAYLSRLIDYIHKNPEKHGFCNDFKDYPYSSYHSHLSDQKTKLARQEVLDWFDGKESYRSFHRSTQDEKQIEKYIIEI